MDNSETVGMVIGDCSLDMKLKEDVAKMRTSLSSCSSDPSSALYSLQTIRSLQVYHQITRIIKYIEICDRIESKLYECIDCTLQQVDAEDTEHLMLLLSIQERLQRIIIESQKILQPYLDIDLSETIVVENSTGNSSNLSSIVDAPTRDKIRLAAQMVITDLVNSEPVQATEQEQKPEPKKRGRKSKKQNTGKSGDTP